jgi:hypothetical protein
MSSSETESLTLNERVRQVLDGRNFASIATLNADGGPQSSIVWMDRDGDTVLFSTTSKQKERNLKRDARISVSIFDLETRITRLRFISHDTRFAPVLRISSRQHICLPGPCCQERSTTGLEPATSSVRPLHLRTFQRQLVRPARTVPRRNPLQRRSVRPPLTPTLGTRPECRSQP